MLNHTCDAGTVPIIDNLYLDMNGVIHNCSHGAGTDANTRMTEDEMVRSRSRFRVPPSFRALFHPRPLPGPD
jgi:5'-3' exonuclease